MLLNPTAYLDNTGCPTSHFTNYFSYGSDLLDSAVYMHFTLYLYRGGAKPPPVQLECKMHVHWWIQQVTTRVGAVTCWIQQPVSPKQVVGFTCVFNSEVDQFIRKFIIKRDEWKADRLTTVSLP